MGSDGDERPRGYLDDGGQAMRRFGPEPPWVGGYKIDAYTYLHWVEVDPLWDGTRIWELREGTSEGVFLRLMEKIGSKAVIKERVSWLEDYYMPSSLSMARTAIRMLERSGTTYSADHPLVVLNDCIDALEEQLQAVEHRCTFPECVDGEKP